MNKLVKDYAVDTQYPDVSGIEHLQMLATRSRLAEIEDTLTAEECHVLGVADQRLFAHAAEFLAEISRFADLAEERRRLQPPPEYWWWYLDVLVWSPVFAPMHKVEPELVLA